MSNRSVKRFLKILFVLGLAALPLVIFSWWGYVEWYGSIPNAEVRVNGMPAGYAHRGPVSTIVTRTDVPGGHSYRTWGTATEILIFDCHNWVAPEWTVFPQGRFSSPCIDRKSTRLNSSHIQKSRMPSSA